MSYVEVTGYKKYPILLPRHWIEFIDKYRFWDKLFGPGISSLDEASLILSDFWRKYAVLHPDFELFKAAEEHEIPLSRVCPLYIHGDEGQHCKRAAVMVVQIQPLF